MQHWMGIAFLLIGLSMLTMAVRHRIKIRKVWADVARQEAEAGRPLTRDRPMNYGDLLPPLVNLALLIGAAILTTSYILSPLSTVISLFDLLGVLFCFAAYGTMVTVKAKHRPPYWLLAADSPADGDAPQVAATDTATYTYPRGRNRGNGWPDLYRCPRRRGPRRHGPQDLYLRPLRGSKPLMFEATQVGRLVDKA